METLIKAIFFLLISSLLILLVHPLIAHSDSPPPNVEILGVYRSTRPIKDQVDEAVMKYCPLEQRGIALYIIQAESQMNPHAVGDHGLSHGLVQIYQPAHPTITLEEAYDISFSVKYLCDNLVLGNGRMWSTFPLH